VPQDSPDCAFDRHVLRLVYDPPAAPAELGQRLARQLSERQWHKLKERWNAIRLAQRQHILRHPGCIPERLERQQWLSRLLVARPRILAEIEYHRQRPAIVAGQAASGTRRLAAQDTRSTGQNARATIVEPEETWATQANKQPGITIVEGGDAPGQSNNDRFLR
jgi:hypothetical protein